MKQLLLLAAAAILFSMPCAAYGTNGHSNGAHSSGWGSSRKGGTPGGSGGRSGVAATIFNSMGRMGAAPATNAGHTGMYLKSEAQKTGMPRDAALTGMEQSHLDYYPYYGLGIWTPGYWCSYTNYPDYYRPVSNNGNLPGKIEPITQLPGYVVFNNDTLLAVISLLRLKIYCCKLPTHSEHTTWHFP
jgi:hypothetical protein